MQIVTSNLYSDTVTSGMNSLPATGTIVNEYLEFSIVNSFVSAIFIKTMNCVGEPLDCHLKM